MQLDTQWVTFCIAMLTTVAFSQALRLSCLSLMKKVPTDASAVSLQPVELAYLLRPGDSAHCLIVLLVDLLQKGLKSPSALAEEIAGATYEKEIWTAVKAYITGWTVQQAHSLVPELATRNPIRIARGFWRLRHWITSTFKSLLSDLIKDPLSLRRYFSPHGLMKLFVSLLGTGVREPLMKNLRQTLLERELLVTEDVRQKYARIFAALSAAHLVVVAILLFAVSGVKPLLTLAIIVVCAAFNGLLLRATAVLPSFLPFYDEVSLVLDSIGRKGFRVALLRGLLRCLRTIFWSTIAFVLAVVCALQSFACAFFLHLAAGNFMFDLLGIAALSLNFLLIADLCSLSFQIANNDQRSSAAESLLKQYHSKLKQVSPITAFSATLSNPEYTPQLSEIVAIYGIETLFLLA